MQWSKLKRRVESFLATSVAGRVELRSTRYRGSHDQEGRGFITFDKKEVWDMCTLRAWRSEYELQKQIEAQQEIRPIDAHELARQEIESQGLFSQYRFYESLEEYCNLSVEEAIDSENILIRALAMLDRRVGKRRLRSLGEEANIHPMVFRFYQFRCQAEGLSSNHSLQSDGANSSVGFSEKSSKG